MLVWQTQEPESDPSLGPTVTPSSTPRTKLQISDVGLYECPNRKTWVCNAAEWPAIRTSPLRLITGR